MLLRATTVGLVALAAWPAVAETADLAAIDAYVARKMDDHLLSGLSLAVIHEGALIHHRGFGGMNAESAIVIGSLSKAITATAVLQLVDAGKVDLDAPATRYVPELALAGPEGAAITVRHLLNQTSGLPASAPRANGAEATLAEHVEALRDVSLLAKPGERHVYASPNYQVLGRLVELVGGEPFGDYVRRQVFGPLRMTHSAIDPGTATALVPGHNVWWGLQGPSAYRFEPGRLPTASLISTAGDLARFVLAHLGGGELDGVRILSPAAVAEAHRGAGQAEGFSYAMGWRAGTTAGLPSLWHGGALPSYRGALVMLPETRSGVVVLSNSSTLFSDPTREIAAGVAALLHGRPTPTGIRTQKQVFLMIAALCAVMVGLGLRGVWRAARGPRLAPAAARRSATIDLLVPAAVVLLVPRFAHVSWRGMLEGAPDIVVTVAILLVLSVASAAFKLARREHAAA